MGVYRKTLTGFDHTGGTRYTVEWKSQWVKDLTDENLGLKGVEYGAEDECPIHIAIDPRSQLIKLTAPSREVSTTHYQVVGWKRVETKRLRAGQWRVVSEERVRR